MKFRGLYYTIEIIQSLCFKVPGDDEFCTPENTCGEGNGDCDTDEDCELALVCGTDNCKNAKFEDWVDCCYKPGKYQ